MSDEDRRFNPLNHELVPLHELVDDAEVPTILAKYGVRKDQLPKIRSDDPAARACQGPDGATVAAEPGQLIKVTRRSPTAGRHVAYRLVVQGI